MKPIFPNNKFYHNKLNTNSFCKTKSTIAIPNSMYSKFKQKVIFHKGLPNYFSYILNKFRKIQYSGLIPKAEKIKTLYQSEGLNLKRIDFEPNNHDWIELGSIALAFGKSRCWLFTFLLKLDLSEIELDTVAQDLANCYLGVGWLSHRRTGIFIRIMRIEPDDFGEKLPEKPPDLYIDLSEYK